MSLVLDRREYGLILLMKTTPVVTVAELVLGDACIFDNEGRLVVIVERKTVSDLIASIFDKRYQEQSWRLEQSGHKIVYIIEGSTAGLIPMQQQMIETAMSTLILNKEFSVMCTANMTQASRILLNLTKGACRKKSLPTTYVEVCTPIKKDNITRENLGTLMLMTLPGISSVFSQAIMKHYISIETLVVALRENPACLDSVMVNGKKLNSAVIQIIKELLL